MAIPDYQAIMLPLLKHVSNGEVFKYRPVVEALRDEFGLTQEERKQLLPSGQQPVFDNRVGWAKSYLKAAKLIKSEHRGYLQITDRGRDVLKENPDRIDRKFLERYEEFIQFRYPDRSPDNAADDTGDKLDLAPDSTPEETLEYAYQSIKADLAQELLSNIMNCSDQFFETLVVDLVVAMGYGGSRKDAGQAMGRSGDGGIDGIIKEDRLGLDIIYIQAKRWKAPVPVKEIRDFAGALLGRKARKGIFITTSEFPKSAREFVSNIEPKIILIDGDKLTDFMIEHNVGVSTQSVYHVKKVDLDYFE